MILVARFNGGRRGDYIFRACWACATPLPTKAARNMNLHISYEM